MLRVCCRLGFRVLPYAKQVSLEPPHPHQPCHQPSVPWAALRLGAACRQRAQGRRVCSMDVVGDAAQPLLAMACLGSSGQPHTMQARPLIIFRG